MLTLLVMVLTGTAHVAVANLMGATPSSSLDKTGELREQTMYTVNYSLSDPKVKMKVAYTNPTTYVETEVNSGDNVPAGTNVMFFVFLEGGYEMESWIINGNSVPLDEDFPWRQIITINQDITVQAIVKMGARRYKVSLGKGQGGSIEGKYVSEDGYNITFDGERDIQEGTEVSIRATPDPNRMVDKWYLNRNEVSPSADDPNLYVLTVSEPAAVYVTFKEGKSGYEVNYTAGEHGSIEKAEVLLPSGITTFNSGESISAGVQVKFTAKPDKGYDVDKWYVNDQPAEAYYAGKTEFETTVQGKMDVKVTFKKGAPLKYPVSWTLEGGRFFVAKYKPEGSNDFKVITNGEAVDEGTKLTLGVNPGENNKVKEWYINGELREDLAGLTATTITIEGKTTIKVICGPDTPAPATHKVTYSVSPKEQATLTVTDSKTKKAIASGADIVEGTEITCQLAILEGSKWQLEKWMVGGTEYTEGAKNATITLTVDKNLEIQAVLKQSESQPKTYKLTYSVSPKEQGVLKVTNAETKEAIASGADVAEGTKVTCQVEISKESKWQLEKWMVGGTEYTEGAKNATITLTVDKPLEIQAVLKDHTSIEAPAESRYVVSLQDGELMIQGLTAPTAIYLYNTTGELILSRLMDATPISLHSLPHGVYYLVVEGNAYKVVK